MTCAQLDRCLDEYLVRYLGRVCQLHDELEGSTLERACVYITKGAPRLISSLRIRYGHRRK